MTGAKTQKYLRVFAYASVFWLAIGILHLGSVYLGEIRAGETYELSPQRWALFLSAYFSWAFLTTFVYLLIEQNPPSKENWRWLLSFVLTLIVWILLIAIINQSLSSILWGNAPKSIYTMLHQVPPFLFLFNALKFIMIYGACSSIFYYRRAQETQLNLLTLERTTAEMLEKKTRLQLQVLQSQLSPHFLFNALNSISGMARIQDHARIVKTVAQLADLLRYALAATNQTEVLLEDELRFTDNYIALQKIRFGDSFNYDIHLQLSDSYCLCPPFCIQTLVENVFSHCDLSSSQPVKIQARVTQANNCIHITLENTPSIPIKGEGTGVALRNLRERLTLLYGHTAQLSTQANDHNFSVSLIFPIRTEDD